MINNEWKTWDYSNDAGPTDLTPDTLVEWKIKNENERNYDWGTVRRVEELSWDFTAQSSDIVEYRVAE